MGPGQLISSLSIVFSGAKYKFLFAALLVLLTFAYFTATNVFVFGTLSLNPLLKLPDATLIFLIALFSSLGFTVFAYKFSQSAQLSHAKETAGASALGIFASACPVCQPACLAWLGFGSVSIFLTEYSTYIALASVLLLLYANYSSLCTLGCCPMKKHRKLN